MNFELHNADSKVDVILKDGFTVYDVSRLNEEISSATEKPRNMRFLIDKDVKADSATIQLLVMLSRWTRKEGRDLMIKTTSPGIVEAINLLQLKHLNQQLVLEDHFA